MDRTNCVIAAVGKNSLHKMWIKGNCNFDLHLIVYDDSIDKYIGDTKHICHIKGFKLKIIYKYLDSNAQIKDKYNYYFFPDDDIMMNPETINSLFDSMRHYNLKIAQPALAMSYYSWFHTLKDNCCRLRYTNFIEMMVPCFSQEVLNQVLVTFNENETGWGTETSWPLLINSNQKDMAIIDEVSVIHTRGIQSGQSRNFDELSAYLQKHNLVTEVHEYGYIPIDSSQCLFCDRKRYHQIKQTLTHWIQNEKVASSFVGKNGYFGYVHFLFLFAKITHSQNYVDSAYDLLGRVQMTLGRIKNNMSFKQGITGCCWLIEFLAQHQLIDNDPQDILEDIDRHIKQYLKHHQYEMSIIELTGIGKYYQIKSENRPTEQNLEDCRNVVNLLQKKMNGGKITVETDSMIDALMLLQKYGLGDTEKIKKLEREICSVPCSQVEHVYNLFRFYQLTNDKYFRIKTKEGLKNLPARLITLEDALMLSEILFYTIK